MKEHEARDRARESLATATGAVQRAERMEAAAAASVKALEDKLAGLHAAQAEALAAHLAADANGAPPVPGRDDIAPKLTEARLQLSVASGATATLRATRANAEADCKRADHAVALAARQALDAELIALAVEFEHALDGAHAIGRRLQEFCGHDVNAPLNISPHTVPRAVERALARMPAADGLHTPVNRLRGFGATSGEWDKRLAALIAGEPAPA